jgi:hypothetical protein
MGRVEKSLILPILSIPVNSSFHNMPHSLYL